MARDLPCDLCETNKTNFMVSNTDTGETLGICYRCIPVFGDAMRAQIAEADAAQDAANAAVTMEPPADAAPDGVSPNRSRRKRAKAPVGNVGSDEAVSEGASNAANV